MRRSVMARSFAMVSSPAFSVPVAFQLLIFLNAASTSHAIIGGTSSGSIYCYGLVAVIYFRLKLFYSCHGLVLGHICPVL